jgi:hypothetical protein
VIVAAGIGQWQNQETQLAIDRAVRLQRPVIPALLPGFRDESALSGFLRILTWVDLRGGYSDEQIGRLVWGITGEKSSDTPSPAQTPVATKWILVAGSGGSEPRPSNIDEICARLGDALATGGFSIVTGGWNGVDHNVARAFAERIQQNRQSLSGRLVQVMRQGSTPDFPGGRLVTLRSEHEAWKHSIERGDTVVLVGGLGGTYQTGKWALQFGKPVFPLADTRGPDGSHEDAYKFYFATLRDWSRNPASRRLTEDQFRDLSNPAPGVVADLLRLLNLTLV